MMGRWPKCIHSLAFLFLSATGWAADPVRLTGQIRLEGLNSRSTLDRGTGAIVTTVDLRITNVSGQIIEPPLHAAVRLPEAGDLVTAGVLDALGGPGAQPYGTWYLDLSGQIDAGLQPQTSVIRQLRYYRPTDLQVSYALEVYGVVNRAPLVSSGPAVSGTVGEPLVFSGLTAEDPDGDPIVWTWDFGDGGTSTEAQPAHVFTIPGIHEVTVTLSDNRGGRTVISLAVPVYPADGVAVGRSRTLDGAGLPLGGVTVTERLDGTVVRQFPSDMAGGFASLGIGAGAYTWLFEKEGHLPVWRSAVLSGTGVRAVPNPWLPARSGNRGEISVLAENRFTDASGGIIILYPAGTFEQPGTVALTSLDGQTLPYPLPRGWSPLTAFHLDTSTTPVLAGQLTARLAGQAARGEPLALVRFEAESLLWRVESISNSDGTSTLSTGINGTGSYAVVVADTGPAAPPAAAAGQTLPESASQDFDPAVLTATGEAVPASVTASTNPPDVTVTGGLDVGPAGVAAGGFWLPVRVDEIYSLTNGHDVRTPDYDTTVFAYTRPASASGGYSAVFPMRPQLLLGSQDLREARVRADIFAPGEFSAAILDSAGGILAGGGIRVTAPAGALSGITAAEILESRIESFDTIAAGVTPVAAFQLNLSGLDSGIPLEIAFAPLSPDSHYVLARLVAGGGAFGLEPVQRFRSDGAGVLASAEPASGPRLPGILSAGQYVLLQVPAAPGLVLGVVSDAGGNPLAGVSVRVDGSPWAAVTGPDGGYRLLAAAGSVRMLAYDPVTLSEGTAETVLESSDDFATVDFAAAPAGPRVVAISPVDGATGVGTVDPVVIRFSKALDPASFGPAAVTVAGTQGAVVAGSLGLNLGGNEATFLAASPFAAGETFQILLAGTITDTLGRPVEGALAFSFTTAAPPVRAAGAQLVIYEPGAAFVAADILDQLVGYTAGADSSMVVAHGTAGTADPEVPVILVNESTGATATVLSNPDGSFASFINAEEEDHISAVFVNANGSRVSVPATKQLFDDGRVGLYRYGGILEAESDGGPVQISIEPESIEDRVTFEMEVLNLATVLASLGTTETPQGQPLGAIRVAHAADGEVTEAADISIPLDRSKLQLPAGIGSAEEATFLLTRAVETADGTVVYEILDTMKVDGDRLVTQSPPYTGILFDKLVNTLLKTASSSFKSLNTSNKILNAMGLPGIQQTVVHQLLLPFMMTIGGVTTDIIGTVRAVQVDADGNEVGERKPVIGASVAFSPPPFPEPGKFQTGTFVSVSRAPTGFYAFKSDIGLGGLGYRLRGTHPRFPNQVAIATNQIGSLEQRLLDFDIYRTDLLFLIPPPSSDDPGEDTTAPRLRISHNPYLPARGLEGDTNGAQLLVIADDNRDLEEITVEFFEGRKTDGTVMPLESASIEFVQNLQTLTTRIEDEYSVRFSESGRLLLQVSATDTSGNISTVLHAIDFDRAPLIPPDPADEDETSPRIVSSWPAEGAVNQAAFPEIILHFSEPVPAQHLEPENLGWITFSSGHVPGSVVPSADRKQLTVRFHGPDTGTVSMSVGSPLTDEAGNPLDQDPGEDGEQAFNLSFKLADRVTATLDIERGSGVAGAGTRLFALERGFARDSELVCFDVSDPANPVRIAALGLPDNPSDLAYIPNYWLQAGLTAPAQERNLVVVIGGTNGGGTIDTATASFKWLWVVDVTDASKPFRLASAVISQDPISLVIKVAASPPLIAYQEIGADVTAIRLVDLPAFVIGHNSSRADKESFPDTHTPGLDLNADGDFADPGEQVSLPARSPANYYGEFYSYAPLNPRERIVDFTVSEGGNFYAISEDLEAGAARFFNVLATIGSLDDSVASLTLPAIDAKRVFTVDGVPMKLDGANRIVDLAFVSVRSGAPTGTALALINVSDSMNPVLLDYLSLPAGTGIPQSMQRRADGLLALAMSTDLLLLDPALLLEKDAQGQSLAVVGRTAGMGSGARSYATGADGLHAVSLGARNSATFTGPAFEFVTFNRPPEPAEDIAARDRQEILDLVGSAIPSGSLRKTFVKFTEDETAASSGGPVLVPTEPLPADHYYVLMHLPGSALGTADKLPLLLASLNGRNEIPLPGDGTRLSPVLVDEQTTTALQPGEPDEPEDPSDTTVEQPEPEKVYPVEFNAYRLSDDPGAPLYNQWLAGPFTLHGSLSVDEAKALTGQLPRAFLRANRRVAVGLSPQGGAGFVDPFRSQTAAGKLVVGANRIIDTTYFRNPLIFIPGVMASELNDGSNFDMWVPVANSIISNLIPFYAPLEDLVLAEDGSTSLFPTDVLRKILLDEIDVQGKFVTYLREDLDYGEYTWDYTDPQINQKATLREPEDGQPDWESLAKQPLLFPFPYDWRQDNAKTAARLKKYVDLIMEAHPDATQVDIVAHSMGGLVGRRFMLDHPGLVENFISIASPFLGAAKAVATLKTGDLDDFALNYMVPSELSIRIGRRTPALHQLMPNRGMFDTGFRPLVEAGWDLDGNGRAFERLDYDQFKKALDGPLYRDYRPDYAPAEPKPVETNAEPFHTPEQYDWSSDDSGTNFYHMVAVQQMPRTISTLEVVPAIVSGEAKPNIGLSFPPVRFTESEQVDQSEPIVDAESDLKLVPGNYFLSYALRPHRGAGDGTVPLVSATRGYGSGAGTDLNAPGAVMAAIVSESTSNKDDKAASHVDVLRHPKLLEMVGRILDRGLTKSELPTLVINASNPNEGESMAFSASASGDIPSGDPVYVWDMGDGRTVNTESGTHVYAESGSYMLTCAVYWPDDGVGTVASKQIQVQNLAPEISLSIEPAEARPGEYVTLRVDRTDTGFGDEHTYIWEFDGETDDSLPPTAFQVIRAHALEGQFAVKVTVTDDEGASVTAEGSYTIDTQAQPSAAGQASPQSLFDEPTLNQAIEYAEVIIEGNDTEEFTTEVESDGGLLTNTLQGIAQDFRGLTQEFTRQGQESLTIPRVSADGESTPASTTITAQAKDIVLRFRVRHIKPDNTITSVVWAVPTPAGADVTLTLKWEEIASANADTLKSWTFPQASLARIVDSFEADEPTVEIDFDAHSDVTQIVSNDRSGLDSTAVTTESVAVVDTVPDDDPATGFDESTVLDGAPVTLFEDKTVPLATVPSRAVAVVANDSRLEGVPADDPVAEKKETKPISEVDAEAVRKAVRDAFALAEPDLRKWLISMDDIWVFEQGTGASLWKGDLSKSRYVKGSSDNDYELFMPVFKQPVGIGRNNPGSAIDIMDDAQIEEFEKLAHTPTYMQGDWYFLPPIGVDSSGRELDVIPDFDDQDAFAKYLSQVKNWRYHLPYDITATLGGDIKLAANGRAYMDVDKETLIGGENLFSNPISPAQIIAATITAKVTRDESLRKTLTDVSFFPFRREHFMFGVPSVELPPPFGDDPLGDAGMGRGLLFLKWVLEGAFLPGDGFIFNQSLPMPDLELRGFLHARLAQRSDAFAKEAYEWGVYQEFAILSESAHLRMQEKPTDAAYGPGVLPDYTSKHDEKIMKKTGKAVIRSVLAEMVSKDASRSAIYAVTPANFDTDPDYLSFEDFIGKMAEENSANVSLTTPQVMDYLGAKLADTTTFNRIRRSQGGVDDFIQDGFQYLKNSVQQPTGDSYTVALDEMLDFGLVYEHLARRNNARAVDHGIQTLGGKEIPGRADWFGLEPGTRAKYGFVVALHKRGFDDRAAGPITVTLESVPDSGSGAIEWTDIRIPAKEHTIKLEKQNKEDKYPFFTIFRDIAGTYSDVHEHTFSLGGSGMDEDSFAADNMATFESRFLQVSGRFLSYFDEVPQNGRTRWVFRRVTLTDAEYQTMVQNEISNDELHSAAVRNGVDPQVRIQQLAADMRTRIARLSAGQYIEGFTKEDLELMTDEELAALSHVGGVPPNSPAISTSEKVYFPLTLKWAPPGPDSRRYLIAMEIPVDQGIEYLPLATGGVKRINALEGNEVVYLDRIRFNKAYVFDIEDPEPFGLPASDTLVFKLKKIKEDR